MSKSVHSVLSKLYVRLRYPNYDQFMHFYKMPENPKIVVLGANSPLAQSLVQTHFAQYEKLNVQDLFNEQDGSVRQVAQALLSVNADKNGVYLENFPSNPQQAQELDNMTNGVNLVINFGETSDSALLKYYDERGLLLNFSLRNQDQNTDIYRLQQRLADAVMASIKL